MLQNESTIIRAKDIQALLNCSKQYCYDVLAQLPTVTLSHTAKQPPRACLRADFERWLSDNNINVTGGTND